ncbi:MAG: 50S ribosomal protein L11 methyltransferase [Rhizobiaceae bacterium]|nr:50S ribosomal protein L11 methyltransferase [Rhizobiaceae bacterium]
MSKPAAASSGQLRYFVVAPEAEAHRLYALLETEFEDDGLPLSVFEVDEAKALHEVSTYAQAGADDVEPRIREVMAGAGIALPLQLEELPDIDWVAHTLAGLKPVAAGPFVVHGSHDRQRRHSGLISIEIEAGLAFGTGHHGTTAGCLETIARVARRERPRRILDLGTGSGVLAIGIAKLLRTPVLATDNDPVATEVAAANARLNGVSNLVRTATAAGLRSSAIARAAPFDLIVANILARPLMSLAPSVARAVAPGGSVILSGILASQRRAVIAAYAGQRLRHVSTIWRDGWVTMHFQR